MNLKRIKTVCCGCFTLPYLSFSIVFSHMNRRKAGGDEEDASHLKFGRGKFSRISQQARKLERARAPRTNNIARKRVTNTRQILEITNKPTTHLPPFFYCQFTNFTTHNISNFFFSTQSSRMCSACWFPRCGYCWKWPRRRSGKRVAMWMCQSKDKELVST